MYGIIYRATRIDGNFSGDGRVYIGATVRSLQARKKEHNARSLREKHEFFHNQLRKHWFYWEVVEECNSKEQLDEREMFWIAHHKGQCFNLTEGGEGTPGYWKGKKRPDLAQRNRDLNWTKELREKVGKSQSERLSNLSEEEHNTWRQKLSIATKRQWADPNKRPRRKS